MDEKLEIKKKNNFKIAAATLLAAAAIGLGYFLFFAAPERGEDNIEIYNISLGVPTSATSVGAGLRERGLIKSALAFQIALSFRGEKIERGGYEVSGTMNFWQVAGVLTKKPALRWVVVPEGLRKEEIAEVLATTLDWDEKKKDDWIKIYTAPDFDHVEGVYFPDTYLIPVTETGEEVAKRFRRRFDEKFAPYVAEALDQNIKWTTLLKLASLIQREAAGNEDMSLISGILWNRLDVNMRLQVDATVQYARGDRGDGFWAPLSSGDREIDSPFNTYKNRGLPPRPIANPGIKAIEAALHPILTDCLYYLHDEAGNIYCSETYEEHLINIDKYLKN